MPRSHDTYHFTECIQSASRWESASLYGGCYRSLDAAQRGCRKLTRLGVIGVTQGQRSIGMGPDTPDSSAVATMIVNLVLFLAAVAPALVTAPRGAHHSLLIVDPSAGERRCERRDSRIGQRACRQRFLTWISLWISLLWIAFAKQSSSPEIYRALHSETP